MSRFELHLGDCLETLRTMPDNSVDSIVTDPPYGLAFMGKRWDYDVPSVEIWAECLRVLKPGGHLLAFAGTRTQHRMAVRIEDAGFEIRDMIAWVYGSGFPKSLDVSKAIDKAAGAEREKVRKPCAATAYSSNAGNMRPWMERAQELGYTEVDGSEPATDAARQWQGWGTALKPALEPITVARKPLGTCATNVLQMVESQLRERGVRGEILWKPENASGAARSKKTTSSGSTRPLEASETFAKNADESVTRSVEQQSLKSSEKHGTSGINPTLGGSESFHGFTTSGCENPLSPPTAGSAPAAESVSVISSPSTTSTAEEHSTENKFTGRSTHNCAEKDSRLDTASFAGIATGLTGSMGTVHISRDSEGFFLWPNGLPEFVPGSPLTVAANVLQHGTGALNIDGCRVATDDGENRARPPRTPNEILGGGKGTNLTASEHNDAGRWPANLIHDGSEPADLLGEAARFFYCAKASRKDRDEGLEGFEVKAAKSYEGGRIVSADHPETAMGGESVRANIHPTVKPTDLMRYLCRLVTPPGGTVLDPFMGSGSTGKAARLEGFRFIGCELSPEYLEIARARIESAIKVL